MKKSLVLGALLLLAFPGLACDQCGCGLLLGVQPYDHANNFGLQWRMRYLHGDITAPSAMSLLKHGGHDGTISGPASYTEEYMVLEARGQVWIGDRFNVTGIIPLLNNFQAVDGIRRADLYAVGDPMLLARYVLLGSTSGPDTTRLRHRLTAGLGVKIPLGRTDVQQFGEILDHDLQPGTGTWDGLASLEYSVRGKRYGTSVAVVGRYNTEMADAHRMGNSGSMTAEVFRAFRQKSFQWLPSVGGYVEYARPDEDQGMQDMTTGGTTVFSNLGVRLWWKALGFSFAWQHALVNDIGSLMIPNRERFVAGINYSFEKD